MWRIVWQYSTSRIGLMSDMPVDVESLKESAVAHLAGLGLVGDIEPVFPGHPAVLRTDLLSVYQGDPGDPVLDLTGYYHAFTKTQEEAESAVARLRQDPQIRYAEVQPRWSRPVRFSESMRVVPADWNQVFPVGRSPFLIAEQGYLAAAPLGIDALFAWGFSGGRGAGVNIVDVESGWNFQHEDLLGKQRGVVYGPCSDDDHGTAVLGIFSGDNNGFGVTGIASDAVCSAASADFDWTALKWNAAAAIYSIATGLNTGDIILLEMHAPRPGMPLNEKTQEGYIAIEYWDPEFAAISYATRKGIHVVEAGGNGGENFDAAIFGQRFDRASRDSGAIMVGGGRSGLSHFPRSRISWSNYGSRMDVQGWGENIVTCGGLSKKEYHDCYTGPDASHCYTHTFGGTSGASPIVVGAVACIVGANAAKGWRQLTPHEMRNLLAATGSPQSDAPGFPASQRIGPLPDLRAAFRRLGLDRALPLSLRVMGVDLFSFFRRG